MYFRYRNLQHRTETKTGRTTMKNEVWWEKRIFNVWKEKRHIWKEMQEKVDNHNYEENKQIKSSIDGGNDSAGTKTTKEDVETFFSYYLRKKQ